MKLRKNIPKLKSTIIYNKKITIRFSKPQYYKVLGEEVRRLPLRDKEKYKYGARKKDDVTEMFSKYKSLLEQKSNGYFHVIKGIYDSNVQAAQSNATPPTHTSLISLIASVPVLITAYNRIRGNKGSMTLGAMLSFHRNRNLNSAQRRFLSSIPNLPDGINYTTFKVCSDLLKKGLYPWGASRRIYIDKPGQPDKKRPITIPPFMDRVIQTAILTILEAIYEPWFEIQNRSFGFRKRKGVHDAIYSLTRRENKGMITAIEGDIKGAYDNVDRNKLLTILSKRIKDRKVLKLIENRLDYQFFDQETQSYVEEGKGIPQGGIDSPYLWNIYMNEFDNHIQAHVTNRLESINKKIRGNLDKRSKSITKELAAVIFKRRSLIKTIALSQQYKSKDKYDEFVKSKKPGSQAVKVKFQDFFKNPKYLQTIDGKLFLTPEVRYQLMKQVKKTRHIAINLPGSNPNKAVLRFVYARYADDWIILGNFPKRLAEEIKKHAAEWLKSELNAQLAEDKTLITDIRNPNTPAHFLGFEIRCFRKKKLAYKVSNFGGRPVLTRVAGSEISSYPDQQRLISRLHMKGYCTKNGKPLPQSWMSTLETFALISRFNAVLLGFGNFYHGFVPKSTLNRWVYIIRFSLLKTLAQKYDTNIKNIFTRFGIRTATGNTISYTVTNTFNEKGVEKVMSKTWKLLTEKDVQERCLTNLRFKQVEGNFKSIEFDRRIPFYSPPILDDKSRDPSIKDDDWTNKIMWVNLRTQASLDAPCCRCGSTVNVQMHHIKHIRKILYSEIPDDKPWLNIMALRNRRQIPVCRECHMNVIHRGTYTGANLKTLHNPPIHTKRGYDNRLINIENYVTPSRKEFYSRNLAEKGWVEVK